MQGIPKIYAEIPDHTIHNGVWRTCAAYRGHKIVDVSIKDLKPQGPQEVKEFERIVREGNWMGWKYIPKTGEPGAEISHPTLFPTETNIKEVSIGAGEVKWHRLTWEQNPPSSKSPTLWSLCRSWNTGSPRSSGGARTSSSRKTGEVPEVIFGRRFFKFTPDTKCGFAVG